MAKNCKNKVIFEKYQFKSMCVYVMLGVTINETQNILLVSDMKDVI